MLKYLNILELKDKIKIIFLLLIGFTSSFLDALGIATVVPLLVTLTKSSTDLENNFLSSIINFFESYGLLELNKIILLLLIIFILKNLTSLLLTYLKVKFSSILDRNLSKKFFNEYFSQDYIFFLKETEKSILSDIHNAVGIFSQKYIQSLISLAVDSFLAILIIFALVFTNTSFFLSALLIFSILIWVYLFLIKNKIKFYGEETQRILDAKLKILNEIYYYIKDIKILLKEKFFFKKYSNQLDSMCRVQIFTGTISQMGRQIIEVFTILLIVSFIYISINILNLSEDLVFANLVIFAAAIYRLVPSVNSMIFNYQMLTFSLPFSERLYKNLQDMQNQIKTYEEEKDLVDEIKLIELKNINFTYPSAENKILKNFNFKFDINKIVGLKGDTGSGKTTMIDILMGLIKPDSGEILVNGKNIDKFKRKWRKSIGYVPQKPNLFNGSILENITFFDNKIDETKILELKKICNLDDLLMKDEDYVKKSISDTGKGISGGQIQKIAIARALYFSPKILILDETTNSLDFESEKNIINSLINLKDLKILLISHNLNTLKYCEKVYNFKNNLFSEIK